MPSKSQIIIFSMLVVLSLNVFCQKALKANVVSNQQQILVNDPEKPKKPKKPKKNKSKNSGQKKINDEISKNKDFISLYLSGLLNPLDPSNSINSDDSIISLGKLFVKNSKSVQFARANPNNIAAFFVAIDPQYPITELDKMLAKKKPGSFFALGLFQNIKFQFAQADLSFVRSRKDSLIAFVATKNPSYPISQEDKSLLLKDIESFFAYGISQNENLSVDNDYKLLANANPNSYFTLGLTRNKKFPVEQSSKDFIRNNPYNLFALGLTQNVNYTVESQDKVVARTHLNSFFTYGILANKSYVTEDTDKQISKNNPLTLFHEVLQKGGTSDLISPVGAQVFAKTKLNKLQGDKVFKKFQKELLKKQIEKDLKEALRLIL